MRPHSARVDELVALAERKGSLYWKSYGMMLHGLASCAVRQSCGRRFSCDHLGDRGDASTGATAYAPWYLSYLAKAHAELGQFDDAWRCIAEATSASETTKEKWCEADIHRAAGEIEIDVACAGRRRKRKRICARAFRRARAAGDAPLSCARPSAWHGFGAIMVNGPRRAIFSRRSMPGSPKASIRRTSSRLARCSTNWLRERLTASAPPCPSPCARRCR